MILKPVEPSFWWIRETDEKDEQGNVAIKRNMDLFPDFEKEYEELMMRDVEISFPNILLSDIKEMGRTKDNYKVLFHLVKSN